MARTAARDAAPARIPAASSLAELSIRATTVTPAAVAVLLHNSRRQIVAEWTRVLKSNAFAGYSDVPLDELESSCTQCLGALIATLRDGDHGKMRRFVHREVRQRLAQGYLESEIDQMLCSLRLAAWPVIAEEWAHDGRAAVAALHALQHALDYAVLQLSDFYQEMAQQKAEEHLAEMEAMNRRLEEISVRDALTGLYNRRYFADRLANEHQRSARHQRPVALLMMDIDFFKKINDTYGHQTGDDVLRAVAQVLIHRTRTIDVVARYGGEEFAALLPETAYDGALLLAERLREHVALLELKPRPSVEANGTASPAAVGTEPLRCTISIGLAMLDRDRMPAPDDLVAAADEALYAAKHGGRNRVAVDPLSVPAIG
ncbi:MAG TPA: GGDEF domain-containing protein [Chloroflexota bacterium]|nr:GGDEF domain-containing protein [Chloroflexota bacterium]